MALAEEVVECGVELRLEVAAVLLGGQPGMGVAGNDEIGLHVCS